VIGLLFRFEAKHRNFIVNPQIDGNETVGFFEHMKKDCLSNTLDDTLLNPIKLRFFSVSVQYESGFVQATTLPAA
jgi:hypothetical protein